MLYLTRKIGESIIIDNDIEISVKEVRGKTVKFGLSFPSYVTVLRKEVHDKIKAQNLVSQYSKKEDIFKVFGEEDTEQNDDKNPDK